MVRSPAGTIRKAIICTFMAFFNLTLLGPQDHVKSSLRKTWEGSSARDEEGALCVPKTVAYSPSAGVPSLANTGCSIVTTVTTTTATCSSSRIRRPGMGPPVGIMTGTTTPTADASHNTSYTRYMELRFKHRRKPQGPNDEYHYPPVMSHDYGRWMVNGQPEKQEWTQHHRHAHVNSEMTRFVDEMSATNKDFSFF